MDNIKLDLLYLANDKTDTLNPQILISDFSYIVAEMLMKNVEFVKKQGMTDAAKDSRDKLIKLMDCAELFNQIATQNASLKLANRNLCIELQTVNNELAEIKRQEKLANSI